MATCKDCIHYYACLNADSEELICYDDPIIEKNCENFKSKSKFAELPCKIGDTVYKICPVLDIEHHGSCEECLMKEYSENGCSIGVRIWDDGSFNHCNMEVHKIKAWNNNYVTILDNWNILYFSSEEEAKKAIEEYDEIREIYQPDERYYAFCGWKQKRRIVNPLCKGAN